MDLQIAILWDSLEDCRVRPIKQELLIDSGIAPVRYIFPRGSVAHKWLVVGANDKEVYRETTSRANFQNAAVLRHLEMRRNQPALVVANKGQRAWFAYLNTKQACVAGCRFTCL